MEVSPKSEDWSTYPTLENCWKLEKEIRDNHGSGGINFEEKEKLVKAKDGIKTLLENAKEAIKDMGSASFLVKCIVTTFMDAVLKNVEKYINALESSCNIVKSCLSELKKEADNLSKNYWEYSKATKFVGIAEKQIKTLTSKQLEISGTHTLQELESIAKERKEYLAGISQNLNLLNKDLNELEELFNQIKEKK
jgi:hypothetical protein